MVTPSNGSAPRAPRSVLARTLARSLVLTLAATSIANAQGSWRTLAQPAEADLRKLAFTDDLTGWAVGDGGAIVHTRDGGQTWEKQTSPTDMNLVDVRMVDASTGFALGQVRGGMPDEHKSAVLRTADGGKSWSVAANLVGLFHAMDFVDAATGCIAGQDGVILRTVDGGLTWDAPRIESQETAPWTIRGLEFLSPAFGLAMGGDYDVTGVVWRTFDGGANWTHMRVAGEPVFAVHAFDEDHLLCVGGDLDYGAGMVQTERRGDAWDFTDLRIWGQADAVAFRDDWVGWSPLGVAGTFMFTTDSGRSWTSLMTPGGLAMYDVQFTSPDVGYMVGEAGTVLGFVPGGSTAAPSIAGGAQGNALLQNSPNPFRPKTEFAFSIAAKGHVTLKIYNLEGREVATVVNDALEAGSYKMPFDAGHLASGVYYYKLEAKGFSDTKKMVILK